MLDCMEWPWIYLQAQSGALERQRSFIGRDQKPLLSLALHYATRSLMVNIFAVMVSSFDYSVLSVFCSGVIVVIQY